MMEHVSTGAYPEDTNPEYAKGAAEEDPEFNVQGGGKDFEDEELHKSVHKHSGEDPDDIKRPMREFSISTGRTPIAFNPVTSLIGFCTLWGLSIWCMTQPDDALETLLEWRGKTALYFTWFYLGTKPILFFFLIYIAIRYGHIRFGGPDAKPEFDNISYFAMLFAAGVAVGIFYYGVSEPLWHQKSHWYANAGYHSQDEIDQFAMTLTIYHWGLSAWATYLAVAVSMGLAGYRFRLPVTFRSAFYPIFGEYVWGWIGDAIDGFSIVVTVAGVCTSLGLGAIQISQGLQRIGWVDDTLSEDGETRIQTVIIWVITAIATASVISGLDIGIKYLSLFAFSLGMFLTLMILVMENTAFLLNLITQTIGNYFQYSIFLLPFHTDAFGQLREGEGRALEHAAASWWMDAWTVFYMAWWTSWACFVGLFVARISKGRTVGETVFYSMVAPLFYCILWFGVWGGAGLRQARQALELKTLGNETFNDPGYFLQEGSDYCYAVPQEDVVVGDKVVFHNFLEGVTPVCEFNSAQASFNVLYSFSFPDTFDIGFGPTLTVLFLIAVAIYFATSSDSGSLIVDHLAANGHDKHHWFQRFVWAITEGAVATALLNAGGSDALGALQAASIIAGLPFTVFLCYLMQTIYEFCERADKNPDEVHYEIIGREFKTPVYGGIFNSFEYIFSLGNVHEERVALGIDKPLLAHWVEFFKGIFMPFASLSKTMDVVRPKRSHACLNKLIVAVYTLLYLSWIALFISVTKNHGLRAWGWGAFFTNATILSGVKSSFREKYNIRGNMLGDFFSSLFFYPQVFAQLSLEIDGEEMQEQAMSKAEE